VHARKESERESEREGGGGKVVSCDKYQYILKDEYSVINEREK
jgi:hypothetical protein